MALTERNRSGRGQVVDVSAQEAFLQASFAYSLNHAWKAPLMRRSGEGVDMGVFALRWGYPALDGEVTITLLFGGAFVEFTPNLINWMYENGECDGSIRDKPWEDYGNLLFSGGEPVSELNRICDAIAAFTSTRTKADLFAEAQRRRVLLAPVAQLGEVLALDHLTVRGFWDEVTQVDGRRHRHPGRFLVASATPLRPLEAGSALGVDTDAVQAEPPRSPAGIVADATNERTDPLSGLKVVDLTWSIAGPYVGRGLADFGATVVRVESRHKVDVTRTVTPLHPGNDDHPLEGSGLYSNTNAGKLGIELDLRVDAAKEVLWDLMRWADVVVESFSAGAFERMGYGYERLREVNPAVILLSSSLPGNTGNLELPGYGNLSSALFGYHITARWPDRPSAGPFGAYSDTVAPRFALAGLLAALDHRRRTGEGQHLDISQAEASLHFLAPGLLDVEVNGREFEPRGNADLQLAPHGVYPSAGEDEWVALAVQSDDDWRTLAGEMGRDDLAELTMAERLQRRAELDEVVSRWTKARTREEAQERLQGLGLAAHRVQNSAECLDDPQLRYREHYLTLDHPLLEPLPVEAPRYKLSATPGRVRAHGPSFGQDTYEVLTELLGYEADRIAEVAAAEAFG
jgi:crotonobetainyl-CoA:carnitine CoA-transferase CaiB-like acyl-CoA transferase